MAKRSSPGFPSTKYLSSSLTCSLLGRARPRLHFLRPSCTHTTESGRNSAQRRAVAVKDVSNLAASTRTTEVSATACVKAVPKIALGISISAAIMSQSRSRSAPTRGAPRPVDSKITCASSWAIVKRRRTTDWPAAQRIRKAPFSRRSSPTTGMSSSSTTSATFSREQSALRSVGGHGIPPRSPLTTAGTASSMRSTPASLKRRRAAALLHLTELTELPFGLFVQPNRLRQWRPAFAPHQQAVQAAGP